MELDRPWMQRCSDGNLVLLLLFGVHKWPDSRAPYTRHSNGKWNHNFTINYHFQRFIFLVWNKNTILIAYLLLSIDDPLVASKVQRPRRWLCNMHSFKCEERIFMLCGRRSDFYDWTNIHEQKVILWHRRSFGFRHNRRINYHLLGKRMCSTLLNLMCEMNETTFHLLFISFLFLGLN